ncbi:hypothetical protein [Streptomyces sp. NPDC006289]|uniref:hypothetical protein n=1 Tax=Streptomyces sp. NPDC006289 TaxID=3156744 RepID=UPI0033AF9FAD
MSKELSITLTLVGAVLNQAGMVSQENVRKVLERSGSHAARELNGYETACALAEFGAAVSVHADDIDSIHTGYPALLADAVAVAGGRVTVTDVRIVEGEGGLEAGRSDRLEFTKDDRIVSIPAEHFAVDYYDHQAACHAISGTAHSDDPRSWRHTDFARVPGAGYDSIMVLATPAQTALLQEHLGLTFH